MLTVADDAYSWVSVTPQQPCLPFRNQPAWGPDENGDNGYAEDVTENIVCCLITTGTQHLVTSVADLPEVTTTVAPTVAVDVEATLAAETVVEGAPTSAAEAEVEATSAAEAEVEATSAAEAIVEEVESASNTEDEFTQEEAMAYESVAEEFEPIWYGRDDGWTGQTYLQGMQFCADRSSDNGENQERQICPLTG